MRLIAKYYLLFLCLNIFFPKIDLGGIAFYFFEITNAVLFAVFFLLHRKVYFNNQVVRIYVAFMILTFLSFWVGFVKFGFFDAASFGRVVKFTFIILYIKFTYYLYRYISEEQIARVLNFQMLFFLLAGAYVMYNMITSPASMVEYIWGYDNRYRLVGFTGYGIGLDGKIERLAGTTSVSMGVFVAFVFLVFLAVYHFTRSKLVLIKLILLLVLLVLTYSRTGLIVLLTGIAYYALLNVRSLLIWKIAAVVALLVVIAWSSGMLGSLSSVGTLSKLTEMSPLKDPRVVMLFEGFEYLAKNPEAIVLGSGYGEKYSLEAVGYPHLEGIFPTTLLTSGIFGVILLALQFYIIWWYARKESGSVESRFNMYLYGIRLFAPGWFLSSLLSGNTFQTDFYFPIIYFIFMVSYLRARDQHYSLPIRSVPAL